MRARNNHITITTILTYHHHANMITKSKQTLELVLRSVYLMLCVFSEVGSPDHDISKHELGAAFLEAADHFQLQDAYQVRIRHCNVQIRGAMDDRMIACKALWFSDLT